ncbi:flagellar M-ring protein FliF [Thiobacillus denitrificans ATCC 25259]|uniref:Flagellar M-ring protein n=1 Tax=Thiobacillus denitrificans (strain ATCC 25259 / T1) TaxID=292415 RepID=Q3SIH5_THIDA|nr:flagellar basal-body MS-ring/collar protein FliF [Thiobacillus denitrificans]AAZ97553.1 flagellar M-ring protein FliF [Thiobacillus denitrificans ATCC 25259]
MAVAGEMVVPGNVMEFTRTAGGRKILLMLGVAASVAVMAAVWMWGQQPEYRVLFSNFSDRDGGAIVAELEKMNVPYKYAEGGGAVLVPADRVHDARLKLASQGLPKGGNVGFELMENQRLGASQFVEQVNFQRAMEGELARSIESVSAVQAARVHLALPKDSIFVSEQKQPTASVLLNLHPGRALDPQQVSAIVHLVASSVPELATKNVTVVDQNGNLLSDAGKAPRVNGMDPSQIKYVQELQQDVVQRIESIITPIVGPGNVRAEATADVDFSRSEQAVESYKPNQTPDAMAIRSQQTSESLNGSANPAGVPGALINQPPAPATAPITVPGQATPAPAAAAAQPATSTRKDATVNYEVDKTIQYVQQAGGGLKRLSVGVVVNYKKTVDKAGKVAMKPLSEAEKTQITNLVKEAMGYNQARGDTVNVVNSPFASAQEEDLPQPPFWKQPEYAEYFDIARNVGKYLLMGIALLLLYLKVAKPLLKKMSEQQALAAPNHPLHLEQLATDERAALPGQRNYQENLSRAQRLANEDPRVVANIVKTWVANND